MTEPRHSTIFGKRKEPHTVIIARGSEVRHFTIRPWLAALSGSAIAAMVIGYLLATSYLVLRDDLIGATIARQARLQQAYEDRISALRAQVDRITSRQLLDQQLMENKVAELLDRQRMLTQRHGRMEPVLRRAGGASGGLPAVAPVPESKPDAAPTLQIRGPLPAIQAGATGASAPIAPLPAFSTVPETEESAADGADRLFLTINQSLHSIEAEQLARIRSLTETAWQTTGEIAEALQAAGLKLDTEYGDTGLGGPLVAADESLLFEAEVRELDHALDQLDALRGEARKLPIANPVPGHSVSSGFGMRRDPLLHTPAHHSGMDFRAPSGAAVQSAGAGTVVSAGWNGGYGRMVEINHGDGLTTRYAHLRSITVKVGQKIAAGAVIGKVGSSGRSTGPHLHFEIRKDGDALDPLRFLKAGRRVLPYL